jgi:peptidyl-prolyl cis-trans isomerase D
MLDALRRGANSWVLKPLLLLLVLAFIVWGVADVFTGNVRSNALATVGSTEISVEEYQTTYGAVMNNLARRFGRRPTAEEARLRGIDRAVLDDLINGATLDNEVRNLGLALPQATIAAAIEKDPGLQAPDGRFDRAAFENFLREIGYSERGYLNLRRREELRQQLTQSMFQDLPVPAALANLVHNWREETRRIQYFTLDGAGRARLSEPDEAKLKEVYDAQVRQFYTPEYRHVVVLTLSAAEVAKNLQIPEEDIKRAYDGDAGARELPERRQVLQIPFKTKAEAEAAAKAIAAGKSFVDAAKDVGATEKDIDLGLVTRAEMFDPAISDAAFSIAKDTVSAPVTGRFSTVLLRITDIQPARTRSLDEMRQEIRDKLAAARVNESVRKLHDAVDDGRAAGRPLKEIAESAKLKAYDLAQIDRLGRKPDGTPGYDGPEQAKILRAAFEGKPGIEIEPVDLDDGGYAWIDVIAITEEKQRPFAEVKDDVKKVWRRDEIARQSAELAAAIIARAEKGETLSALAKEFGAKLQTSAPFKRSSTDAGVPAAVVQRAFSIGLGARAAVDVGGEGNRIVFRLVEINKAVPPTREQVAELSNQLRSEMQQDAVQAFVLALRERFGVRENKALFDRTTGATPPDQR